MRMQGWHFLVLLLVVLLLFGVNRLPALAKSVGQSARVFKGEMKAMKEEDGPAETPNHQAPPAPSSVTPLTPPPAQGPPQGPAS